MSRTLRLKIPIFNKPLQPSLIKHFNLLRECKNNKENNIMIKMLKLKKKMLLNLVKILCIENCQLKHRSRAK